MFTFSKNRVETFSDGVIAIIITIMVLDIPLPDAFGVAEITGFLRSLLIFLVSFLIVGSHWSNHHFLFSTIEEVSNTILWRNLLFLFFLSLIPIFTKWMILHPDEVVPALGYDLVYLLVHLCDNLIWASALKQTKNEKIYEQVASVKNARRNRWWGGLIIGGGIIAILALSFYYPRFSLIFFIGFPASFSLVNLFLERNGESGIPTNAPTR